MHIEPSPMAFKRSAVRFRLFSPFKTKPLELKRFNIYSFFRTFSTFLKTAKGALGISDCFANLSYSRSAKMARTTKTSLKKSTDDSANEGRRTFASIHQQLDSNSAGILSEPTLWTVPDKWIQPPIPPLVFWLRKVFQYNSVQNVDWFSLYCIIFLQNK